MPGALPPAASRSAAAGDSAVDRRPMLDPWRVGVWTTELLSVPFGLMEAYLPGTAGIGARTREQLILRVSEANGARTSCWIHGSWLDFLGARDPDEALAPLFDYAVACAAAGLPLDTTTLDAVYPAPVVRSLRATVATAHLGSFVDNTAAAIGDRLRGRPGAMPTGLAQQIAAIGVALPFVAPTVAVAVALRILHRMAPTVPTVELPSDREANLVAHLLVEALPSYLGNTALRTGLVWSPVPITVAVRVEGVAASIRLGRGRVVIDNGINPDALVIVDGGSESLLRLVTGSILRDLTAPISRR